MEQNTEKKELLIPVEIEQNLSLLAKKQLSTMSDLEQAEFVQEYNRKKKKYAFAALLWLFSCHYAYVGKWGMQIVFWITWGGLFIWWLVDAFRMTSIVNEYNRDLAIDIIRQVKLTAKM